MKRSSSFEKSRPIGRRRARPMLVAATSRRTTFLIAVVIGAATCTAASPVSAQPQQGNPPVYLALGDSYPYGSACLTMPCAAPEPGALFARDENGNFVEKNDNFHVGYPEYLQQIIDLPLMNVGCPGDTTDSFLHYPNTAEGPVCRRVKEERPDMLHVDYSPYTNTWAQMDYAENYLAAHPDRVRVITLQLGGPQTNRFFQDCQLNPTCILDGLPAHTASLIADLSTILSRLRATGYPRQIIYVEYPSTNYNGFLALVVLPQIYQAVAPALAAYGAQKAPIFDAFKAAAAPFGGNSCTAGLLITNANGSCNVHATAAGHQLIASIISGMVQPQ